MKDALNENDTRVRASPEAPQVATCPACGGDVVLRSRKLSKNPDEKRPGTTATAAEKAPAARAGRGRGGKISARE